MNLFEIAINNLIDEPGVSYIHSHDWEFEKSYIDFSRTRRYKCSKCGYALDLFLSIGTKKALLIINPDNSHYTVGRVTYGYNGENVEDIRTCNKMIMQKAMR